MKNCSSPYVIKGSINENSKEILLHTQNGQCPKHWQHKMLVKMWVNRKSHFWESLWLFLTKVNNFYVEIKQSCSLVFTQRRWQLMSIQNFDIDVVNSLLKIAEIWKQWRCPSVRQCMSTLCYFQKMLYNCLSYQTMKRHGGTRNAYY